VKVIAVVKLALAALGLVCLLGRVAAGRTARPDFHLALAGTQR
jgi:hypothetical protein